MIQLKLPISLGERGAHFSKSCATSPPRSPVAAPQTGVPCPGCCPGIRGAVPHAEVWGTHTEPQSEATWGCQGGMALGHLIQCHFWSAPQKQQFWLSLLIWFQTVRHKAAFPISSPGIPALPALCLQLPAFIPQPRTRLPAPNPRHTAADTLGHGLLEPVTCRVIHSGWSCACRPWQGWLSTRKSSACQQQLQERTLALGE